jgi:hypothetical protein
VHGPLARIEAAQAALGAWRKEYNITGPRQAMDLWGMPL